MARQRSRTSGRKGRLAQRAAPPTQNPCAPGQLGGAYKPLTPLEVDQIYHAALDLLNRLGMGEVPARLHRDLLAAGAHDDGAGRVTFPTTLVEDAIDQAAKTFVLHGRDPNRSIEIGGDSVHFGEQQLDVLHCPGHTPGHVVLFLAAARLAFVGDVLFQGSVGRSDFPMGDHDTLIRSIRERLWPLGDDVMFIPGHGPTSTFGQERKTNQFVSDYALS